MSSSKKAKNKELTKKTEPVAKGATSTASDGSTNDESEDDVEKDSTQGSKSVGSVTADINEKKEQAEQEKKPEEQEKEKEEADNELTSPEDKREMIILSRLSRTELVDYIKELDAEIYELGQREARELSRSKHLRIFGNNRRRGNKRE